MNKNELPDPPSDRELFGNLLASRPKKERKAAATALSLLIHGGVVAGLVWATLAMAQGADEVEEEQITLFQIEEEPPPPPPPPPPPEAPPPPPSALPVPKGFQTLAAPEIIPPEIPPPDLNFQVREMDFTGEGVEGGRGDGDPNEKKAPVDITLAPVFTPMTVKPRLKNAREVARALERHYPPILRDSGIGGTVVLWFLIDEQGNVVKTQLRKSSGYDALDEAAPKVAAVMKFSPAMNRDEKVKVWVEIPITFQTQ
ncbi:MAG TPA: TonB family protein [Longimicrobiales bacterium]